MNALASPHPEAPAVLCLHSTGSSSRQWSHLAVRLAPRFRVVAADLIAHGRGRPWARGEAPGIEAELDALAPLVEAERGPMHVVGHSYGGAVAIRLAMRHPGRFSTVTAFEPVMFQALLQARPDDEAALQPVRIAGRMHAQICAGRPAEAARLFYDYWSGEGAWSGLEPEVQRTIAARMPAIYACFQSLFADRTSREELARMRVPTLLLSGDHSPASGRAATRLMAEILPKAWWKALPGMGHMGPVEQPERVNAEIARFLKASQRAPVAYRPFDTGNFQGWGAAVPA